MNWVYDIETFPNCFTVVFEADKTEETREFVIHNSRNQTEELQEFINEIKRSKGGMIGFNNLHFDWILIDYFVEQSERTKDPDKLSLMLYSRAQAVISSRKKEYIQTWIPQLDLYLINHYDNKNRTTSLKALQCTMKYPVVMDMPIHHSSTIGAEDIETVLKYNRNDVKSTKEFYKMCADKIELRKKLSKSFKQKFINKSDVSIGESIFIKYLSQQTGIHTSVIRKMRSPGSDVPISNIIFPYVKFETPKMQHILSLFNKAVMGKDVIDQVTAELNSANSDDYVDILESYQVGLQKPAESKKKKSFSFSTIYNNIPFDYGIGGVHACIWSGTYRSDDKYLIIDVDVKSYYPNISIRNGLKPRHFSNDFVEVYEMIFNQRVEAQKVKDTVTSDGLKLSLNGVFGKTLDKFSCMYDPVFFAGIVVNGQLMISMLAELLVERIPEAQLLQVNTDGLTIRIPRTDESKLTNICQHWEGITKLTLEYKNYAAMFIRDVNNYIGLYEDGSRKEKGVFDTNKEWHKDHSMRIVPIAVGEYFVKGTPIGETLRSHPDLYDFCLRYKGASNFELFCAYLKDNKETMDSYGKILRYLPTVKGQVAIKKRKSDGAIFNLLKGVQVEPMNEFHEIDRKNINYDYFQYQCIRLIESVNQPQSDLLR